MATKAHEYLESLYGEKGSELEMDLRSRLSDKSASSLEKEENDDGSTPEEDNIFITLTKFKSQNQASKTPDYSSGRKILPFTPEEDKYLKMGLDRHGFGNWTAILRANFYFQKGRKPNSLLNRASRKSSSKCKP